MTDEDKTAAQEGLSDSLHSTSDANVTDVRCLREIALQLSLLNANVVRMTELMAADKIEMIDVFNEAAPVDEEALEKIMENASED